MELPPNRTFTISGLLLLLLFLHFSQSRAEDERVISSLMSFLDGLSGGNAAKWGWTNSTDPCKDNWTGIKCNTRGRHVRKLILDDQNFTGTFDAASLCAADSLSVLSLNRNSITGEIQEEISKCSQLSHIYLSSNRLSGHLPPSMPRLINLKTLDISDNDFSGELPDLGPILGISTLLVQNNGFTGPIPGFHFDNFRKFNVSNNNFTGSIPDDAGGKFSADSFLNNPALCGPPLPNACPPPPPPPPPSATIPPSSPESAPRHKDSSTNKSLIISGYAALGSIIMIMAVMMFLYRRKAPKQRNQQENAVTVRQSRTRSTEIKTRKASKQEYSITSVSSGSSASSTPLVVLTCPALKELRFEDLLRAPAELLGRGKHGSLYKVMLENGATLAVKRMKDWSISCEDFKARMQKMDQVRHPNVLPALAFYCSNQEKLLVYEYQPNGSLFTLLNGSQNGQEFNWGRRLSIAMSIAEALAYMHGKLLRDKIAHGNLKSTNILFTSNMEPYLSEYGLMLTDENQDHTALPQSDGFKADTCGLGVILLELLTGKVVQNNASYLEKWVHSVVKEEWKLQVFDRMLVSEGASEERMVSLLQLALKCISPVPSERPDIKQILSIICTIKEDEERSESSDSML